MRLSNAVQNALLIRAAHSMQSDWAYIHSPLATPPSTGEHICQQFRLLMSFITKLYRQTNDIRLYTVEGTYGRTPFKGLGLVLRPQAHVAEVKEL